MLSRVKRIWGRGRDSWARILRGGGPLTDQDTIALRRSSTRAGPVIVCGLGGLGLRVVEVLHGSSAPLLVIDDEPDPKALPILERWGVDCVRGNPRLPEVLLHAGLAEARAVVSVQADDLRNLETALVVHSVRPDVRIIVQMANLAVGQALSGLVGSGAALDVVSLAAPALGAGLPRPFRPSGTRYFRGNVRRH